MKVQVSEDELRTGQTTSGFGQGRILTALTTSVNALRFSSFSDPLSDFISKTLLVTNLAQGSPSRFAPRADS